VTRKTAIPQRFTVLKLKLTLAALHAARSLPRELVRGLRLVSLPLGPVRRLAFRLVLVKPYELWLRLQRSIGAALAATSWRRVILHHQAVLYLVTATALVVSWNSYHVRSAAAEDFGQRNLLFPLIQNETEGYVTEGGAAAPVGSAAAPALTAEPQPADSSSEPTPLILAEDGSAIVKPTLVATLPGVVGRSRIETYTIKPGDTLAGIAQRFALNLTTLLWENNLTQRSLLRIAQTLTILPVNGVSYRIAKNDTVAKIAQRFRVPADEVAEFNQLEGKLVIGRSIVIPGGRPLTTPAPARPASATAAAVIRQPEPSSGTRSGRLLWPTVRRHITQYYSWRHTGVDIADSAGTPVYAAADGRVEVAGWNRGGYGYYIIINHDDGVQTLYAHNNKFLVGVGDSVTRGQQIANMGSTGRSTGPHVHFEVRVNGRRVNPLNYIR